MSIVGITGSSGAGKSTVSDILEAVYGAKVINADKIAKELSKKGTDYLREIEEKFGKEILLENGELNRKKLAYIIYQNPKQREILNNCTFKYIRSKIQELINEEMLKIKDKNIKSKELIVIDAPLLFEAGLDKLCDYTIAVISENRNMQIERIMKRDGIDKEHAEARLNAQKEDKYYISKCNYKIVNDNKIEDLKEQLNVIQHIGL